MLIINTTWKNPENTMLSERSQSTRDCRLYDSIYQKRGRTQVSGCLRAAARSGEMRLNRNGDGYSDEMF